MGKTKDVARGPDGRFPKGVSGNPVGRAKGSRNKATLYREMMDEGITEKLVGEYIAVLDKAIVLAKQGHPGMIKLVLKELIAAGLQPDADDGDSGVQINIRNMTINKTADNDAGITIDHEDLK